MDISIHGSVGTRSICFSFLLLSYHGLCLHSEGNIVSGSDLRHGLGIACGPSNYDTLGMMVLSGSLIVSNGKVYRRIPLPILSREIDI